MSLTERTQALPGWAKDWLGAAAAAVEGAEGVEAAEAAAGAVAADAVAAAVAGHGVSAASASLATCELELRDLGRDG